MTTKTIYLSFDLSDEEFKIYSAHAEDINIRHDRRLHTLIKERDNFNKMLNNMWDN